jgi:inorganic triphosphatase YgiF
VANTERKLKLGVWAGFSLPDLGLAPEQGAERRTEANYYDTADLRLLRHGVTLREAADGWTVRTPHGARSVAGASGAVPEDLRVLTLGWALGEPLERVAQLVTLRRTVVLRDGRGREVATIGDDDIAVLRGRLVAARFRELELRAGSSRRLERLASALRDVGAQPVDRVPKLVRALGQTAVAPVVEANEGPTAADAVSARLGRALARWSESHAALLLDGTPESVRAVRSGARALRRELRAFPPAADVREGLAWLVGALTPVHRVDQLLRRMDAATREGGGEAEPGDDAARGEAAAGEEAGRGKVAAGEDEGRSIAVAGLRSQLAADRADALATARARLRDERYAALLRDVARLVERPPLAGKAARPPEEVLPRLVREPLRRVRRDSVDDLEQLRRRVDRLYVAARAAAPYAGPDARRAVGALADLRALLREHHRALASVETLRALAERKGENAWEAGLLAGAERALAAEARAGIADALERATRRKLWAWVP